MTQEVVQDPRIVSVPTERLILVKGAEPQRVSVREVQTGVVEVEKVVTVEIERRGIEAHILAAGAQGPQGPQGVPGSGGGGGSTTETYVAGVALGGQRVVVTDGVGLAIYADNLTSAHANMATKITLGAAAQGDTVAVQLVGRITEPSWSWAPGGTIYVGTNGLLTQTQPAPPAVFSKPVAVAETATTILLIQEPPVMFA